MQDPFPQTRLATINLFEQYLELINAACIGADDPFASDPSLSLNNLRFLAGEAVVRGHSLPLDKISRWLGFIQGCLAMRGIVSVTGERNATRTVFHAAYAADGIEIPPTVENTTA